jgi:hypothetical protein
VLYQPQSIQSLANACAGLLAPGGTLLLADTALRPGKQGLRELFMERVLANDARLRLHVESRRTVQARLPAAQQDVNTGDVHAVELTVMRNIRSA